MTNHLSNDTDSVYLDVFSLGAIAYYLFTGKKPAESDLELQDKLSRGNGLQVTDEINGASEWLQYLVQYATHPELGSRMDSVNEFIEYLDNIEDELTRPDSLRTDNPTEAREGDTFEGGITVKKRLGKGASSVVFLVEQQGKERVFKIAADPSHNQRLAHEGKILGQLRHQSIIACHETMTIAGQTCLLIDYASEGTLAMRLRKLGPVQLELLERFGEDLLGAIAHLEDKAIFHRDIKPENIGLTKQGSQLHLVLFDFSLSNVSADNITAGTVAYMDPFIRDAGRRRWDDFAERFAAALTLYEMAAGTLPGWASHQGNAQLLGGELEIDGAVFDPAIRENMVAFFRNALTRDVRERFANAGEMLRSWRKIFLEAGRVAHNTAEQKEKQKYTVAEAQLDTQIGLLNLSIQALDALGRRNINTVAELVKLNRSQVRVWPGVGSKTRQELSKVIDQLQQRLLSGPPRSVLPATEQPHASIDRVFAQILPKETKSTDPDRRRFLNEYLGRLDSNSRKGRRYIHWPTLVMLSAETGLESGQVRALQRKVVTQWGKTPSITELRNEIADILAENGGVVTAMELSEMLLLRRGSVQESPVRERWSDAVTRAAVETELSKQNPRWIMRRAGRRIIIADDTANRGEELADYAEALGQLADECAEHRPLLSPIRVLERVRAVSAPESFEGLSNHRLLRLAAAASQGADLSSRAEFYPRSMKAAEALELAQGALLGSTALTVRDVQSRVAGRYPAAEPLPGRPRLDELMAGLDMGFTWNPDYPFPHGEKGGYCLPVADLARFTSKIRTQYHYTQVGEPDFATLQQIKALDQEIQNTIESPRFLALTVRPSQWRQAQEKLSAGYSLRVVSFDEMLLRHLHRLCDSMSKPPNWSVVLKADAAAKTSRDWQNLQRLVNRVLPEMLDEIRNINQPVLLTEPGLLARYGLVNTWLDELRRELTESKRTHGVILLVAADAQNPAAVIDGVTVPAGAGSKEFSRLPTAWLEQDKRHSA